MCLKNMVILVTHSIIKALSGLLVGYKKGYRNPKIRKDDCK